MRAISRIALAFLLCAGATRLSSAELIIEGVENGVRCDPPDVAQVVDDRFVRTPMDPSNPDVNNLPTGPLVVGTLALSPDVSSSERTKVGYGAYVACVPGGETVFLPEG